MLFGYCLKEGSSHHFWTHGARASDQPTVIAARQTINQQLRSWLAMPDLPTAHSATTTTMIMADASGDDAGHGGEDRSSSPCVIGVGGWVLGFIGLWCGWAARGALLVNTVAVTTARGGGKAVSGAGVRYDPLSRSDNE